MGFIQNRRKNFLGGSSFSLLEIVSLTRSKEVSSKSSTKSIDSVSCLLFPTSSVARR
jgi:hypothetical protein